MLLSRAFSLRSHGRKMPHSQWSLDFCVALLHLFKWVTDDDHDDECIQLCIYRYICASWYFPRLPGYLHWINNGLRVCLISLPSSPKRYLQMNIPRFIFPYVSLTHNFFPHYYLNFFRYSCTAYIFFLTTFVHAMFRRIGHFISKNHQQVIGNFQHNKIRNLRSFYAHLNAINKFPFKIWMKLHR